MSERPLIAGIGEMLWDVYPDAEHFGGAPANFACHAAGLGARAWMASAVGVDDLGDRALEFLRERGVECGCVSRDPVHATGKVLVTLDALGRAGYEFAADTAWDHLAWSQGLALLAPRCDAVCFGTLGQRSATARDTIRRFVSAVPRSALRVLDVNLRQRFFDRDTVEASLRIASAIKLNEEELSVVADLCRIDMGTPRETMQELMSRYGLRLAALTRGPAGALLLSSEEESESAAVSTPIVDTVGAGDAFTATLIVDFLRGYPLAAINRHANAVASYVCSQPGATSPLPAELLQFS